MSKKKGKANYLHGINLKYCMQKKDITDVFA